MRDKCLLCHQPPLAAAGSCAWLFSRHKKKQTVRPTSAGLTGLPEGFLRRLLRAAAATAAAVFLMLSGRVLLGASHASASPLLVAVELVTRRTSSELYSGGDCARTASAGMSASNSATAEMRVLMLKI